MNRSARRRAAAALGARSMKALATRLQLVAALWLLATGCHSPDPAARFITRCDRAPAQERPPDWEQTKRLMSRPVPAVGQVAPDFTLPALEEEGSPITRSAHQGDRALVLIFGSFT